MVVDGNAAANQAEWLPSMRCESPSPTPLSPILPAVPCNSPLNYGHDNREMYDGVLEGGLLRQTNRVEEVEPENARKRKRMAQEELHGAQGERLPKSRDVGSNSNDKTTTTFVKLPPFRKTFGNTRIGRFSNDAFFADRETIENVAPSAAYYDHEYEAVQSLAEETTSYADNMLATYRQPLQQHTNFTYAYAPAQDSTIAGNNQSISYYRDAYSPTPSADSQVNVSAAALLRESQSPPPKQR